MSQPETPREPSLSTFETALRSLAPAPARLDRDRLMFQAGQAQARRTASRWSQAIWPAMAAGLALVVAGQSLWLARKPEVRVIERLVVVPPATIEVEPQLAHSSEAESQQERVPPPQRAQARPRPVSAWLPGVPIGGGPSRYVQLRQNVLRFGLDALPESPPVALAAPATDTQTSGALLRSEIEALLKPGEPS